MGQYGNELIGLTLESVEISNNEVLITFAEGGEMVVTVEITGGDYGTPILQTVITKKGGNDDPRS